MQTIDFRPSIDIQLLKEQRNHLLTMQPNDHIDGLINLLDHILDQLEA